MGSENSVGHVYDLRRIEDVFACLEVISVARGALYGVDPELAGRMAKVSDALGALAQLVMEGGLDGLTEADEAGPAGGSISDRAIEQLPPNIFSDMTVHVKKVPPAPQQRSAGNRQTGNDAEEKNGIVDILTGERIK